MPRKKKHEKYIRVLAFDPSMKITGYSILDYDKLTDTIYLYRVGKLVISEILKNTQLKEENKNFDRQFTAMEGIGDEAFKLMQEYKPAYVVSESAYLGVSYKAVMALSKIIFKLRSVCKEYNNRDIYMVAPKQTKAEITDDANADKIKVRDCLLTNEKLNLVIPKSINLEKLVFDETDAIGHGVTFIKRSLPTILLEQQKRDHDSDN